MNALLRYPVTYCIVGLIFSYFEIVRHNFWWGIIVLGGLIALYAWFSKDNKAAERLKAADNCYFIGFVYTLSIIALSIGLDADILLEGAGPKQLLETIGIALGSSIVGMIARFILSHNVEIPEDEFDSAISRAAQATYKLEGTMTSFDIGVENARNSVWEAATAMNEYEKKLAEYVENIGKEAENIGPRMNQVAEEIIKNFGENVNDFLRKKHFDKVCQKMEESAEKYCMSVDGIAEDIEKSSKHLAEAGKAAVDDVKSASETLVELQRSIADMPEKITDSVNETMRVLQQDMSENFTEIEKTVDGAMGSMRKAMESGKWSALGEAANNFSAQLDKINEGLGKIGEQQERVLSVAFADVDRLRAMRDNFSGLMEDMKKDVQTAEGIKEEYRKKFDEAATAALDETHRLYGRLITGAEIALSQMDNLKTLTTSLEKISKHLEKIEK